jgi:hypothetical protein
MFVHLSNTMLVFQANSTNKSDRKEHSMLTKERVSELSELLPWVYFVGMGYWPNKETFALGLPTQNRLFVEDIFSAEVLDTGVERMRPFAPQGYELIFFMIAKEPGKIAITKEEVIWLLNSRCSGY